ncbi:MAG TPA: amino acid adenylation domain-containing protein [Anaerolineae bacterium]|nr:amino acid adenylation domain-containing protein [Anaerolineae bacterium]
MHLTQALAKRAGPASPRLCLITRGAQPVTPDSAPLAIAQSALAGLARVINLEHPELSCVQIDLDTAKGADEIEALLTELNAPPDENQIAFRQGVRYVPRLIRARSAKAEPGRHRLDGFRADGTYVITGGRGGLGLQVAQWLIEQGARQLVLVGRSAPTEALRQAVDEWERSGAHILLAQADVSDEGQVAAVLAEIGRGMPPLRGIVHAAGVLDDGVLARQEWGRFARVLAPKVQGAWNLHTLTLQMPLDFFVLFSSTTSLLGSPGLGNYAAANAFLDGLAHYRRAQGLPGLSINWGAWGEVGMGVQPAVRERMALFGIEPIAPPQGLHALEHVLRRSTAQIAVASIDWRKLLEQFPLGSEPPLLSELFGEVRARQKDPRSSAAPIDLLSRLEEAPPDDRRRVLTTFMCEQVRKVLHLDPSSELDVRQPLNELGLDSLVAIEVRNVLGLALGRTLPATVLFEYPTIEGLSNYLADEALHLPDSKVILRTPRVGELPLSFAQERMWFLHQLEPDSPLYNIAGTIQFQGSLNIPALEHSLNEIVRRHEALRTAFPAVEGLPRQVIAPDLIVPLPIVDLSSLTHVEQQVEVQRWSVAEARRPFDLTHVPLLRATLLRLNDQEHVLILVMYHIVSDGWSVGILAREFGALYPAFAAGQPSPLPELPIQYADYAAWQRAWLQGEVLEKQLTYWQQQLADSPPVLELPTDRPHPAQPSYRGGQYTFPLSPQVTPALHALSQREGATLFMTLLAAFKVLLYRYTGQTDIVVGTLIANRNRAEWGGLIGFFVNTLALRTQLSGDMSFREALQSVREVALGAYAHQDLPFEMLLDALQVERSLNQTPLFQVLFLLENTVRELPGLPGLTTQLRQVDDFIAQFDLSLSVMEAGSELIGAIEYNTDLFDEATITRMSEHYRTLLESSVADPQRRISDLPLLTAAEKRQLLVAWNATHKAYPHDQCFNELFEQQVARTPDNLAAVCGNASLTYAQLNERANSLAALLVERQVGPDTVVTLLAERSLDFLTAMLAVFKAGGAYLPIDPRYPAQRIRQVLGQSQSRLVLTTPEFVPVLADSLKNLAIQEQPEVLQLPELLSHPPRRENLPTRCTPHHLAYVIYTSGSTGVPKGAMVEQRGMINHLYAKIGDLALTDKDVIAQTASQSFDISVWQFLAALLVGGRVHIFTDEIAADPVRLLAQVECSQVTILETVPSLLRAMLDQVASDSSSPALGSLRWLIPTGEALPPELARQWFEHYPRIPLLNAYGPTECSDDVTHHPLHAALAPDVLRIPIGRPIANMRLYVLDRALQLAPVGVPGEVYVGGEGVGRGYLHAPCKTAEAFRPDPFSTEPGARLYKTGDLGYWHSSGHLEFLGRADHQVKVRGFRIELGGIEAVLEQHADVRTAVVLARAAERAPGEKQLVAYIVPRQGSAPTTSDLREHAREQLPDYMLPSAWVLLEALPLTPNGKVDRRALPPPGESRSAGLKEFVAPEGPLEEKLAEIWRQTLRVDQISAHDNFFDRGGYSLIATQVIYRMNQEFQIDLPLRSLFEAPTIARMALLIEEALLDKEEALLNELEEEPKE